MHPAKLHEVGQPCHSPIILKNLANDARGVQPSQARKIDRCFRVASALENAASEATKREDVSRSCEIFGLAARIDGSKNRLCAIRGRDASCDATPLYID